MNKTVQLATKPKRAAPKAKYIDPIIQTTFANDGSLQEVARSLQARMRDPNTTVVFKSLIVVHTLLRSGSVETTFDYLSSSSVAVQLASASDAPNLSAYGKYLAARLKAYSNLKRDVIRDKSDRRAAGRLRNLEVDRGLLREVREVQRMIAALVESKFFLDDVDDDVSMTALRLLVKDLLVLFTAVNEGVINVLEHYFEMSHPDATTALKIYKTFCRDTEKVVAYLGVAKKLHNVLNVPVPNLKHAPVSLVGSLEEYLNDPNFAKNREEYKENKRIADGGAPKSSTPTPAAAPPSAAASSTAAMPSTPVRASPSGGEAPATVANGGSTNFTDFFASIESAQTPMFNPATNSPSVGYFHQQAQFNPFLGPQMTGAGPSPFGAFPQMQMQPQMTGFAPNPFGLAPQQTGFVQPQQTGFMNAGMPMMQPQMTGANPFRQSMMPQPTGMGGGPFGMPQQQLGSPFGQQQMAPQPTGAFGQSPFGQPQQQQPIRQMSSPFGNPAPVQAQMTGASPFGNAPRTASPAPFGNAPQQQQQQQPSSAGGSNPFGAQRTSSPFGGAPPARQMSAPAPLTQQKTGARNPFNPAPGEVQAPPQPQGPSMNALAWQKTGQQQQVQQQQTGATFGQAQQHHGGPFGQSQQSNFNGGGAFGQQQQQPQPQQTNNGPFGQQQPQQQQTQQTGFPSSGLGSPFGQPQQQPNGLAPQKTGGLMADIASDFALGRQGGNSSPAPAANGASSNAFSNVSTSSNPTGNGSAFGGSAFSSASFSSSTPAPLSSQPTGFGGSTMRAFQPTSSFGAQIAAELGGSSGSFSSFSSAPPQQTQQAPAPMQQPQPTGFNPFRGSTLPPLGGSLNGGSQSFGGAGSPAPLSNQPTGMRPAFQPTSSFGTGLVGQQTGQPQQMGSLI